MGLILSIETSTPVCSVSLHQQGNVIGLSEFFEGQSHSKLLMEQINFLVKQAEFHLSDLDAIAVSGGPGSYTGLRIGVATAKGLCFTIEKPLISVNTLEAMAYGVNQTNPEHYNLCTMIDARRMEVYCTLVDSSQNVLVPTQALIIDEGSFEKELQGHKILFFGNGSEKCKQLLSDKTNALFINNVYPSAINVGYLAFLKYQKGIFEDVAYYEPNYLKEFNSTQKKS